MGLQVVDSGQGKDSYNVKFLYLTQNHMGRPQWQSALLQLSAKNVQRKHIGVMALYNHYTIMGASECPTAGYTDLQQAALAKDFAVVSADYEGFGETADKIQAYCTASAWRTGVRPSMRCWQHGYADRLNIMQGWTPDANTRLKIYHSQQDDVVPFGNSRALYQFFQNQGCTNVAIDSTSLNVGHSSSGMMFVIALMSEFNSL